MVKLRAVRGRLEEARGDLLLVPVVEGEERGPLVRRLDRLMGGRLGRHVTASGFRGRAGEVVARDGAGRLRAVGVVALVGIGPEKELELESWRRFGARGRKEAERVGARRTVAYLPPPGDGGKRVGAVAEGFLLAGYRFSRYKSEPERKAPVDSLALLGEEAPVPAAARHVFARLEAVIPCVFRVRDLVNSPPSVVTPSYLAAEAKRVGKEAGCDVEVWDRARIERERMAGLLAVSRGSHEEPRFVVLRWRPDGKPRRRVALVGKGLTFDAGGLSLKTPKAMETMKLDMAGGATVLGTLEAVAKLRPGDVEVTGYIPATENLPGGGAQKPGDVITFLNGKTVEVLNTDAEGRLILADALAYAATQKPDVVIDLATLTGACMVALGTQVAGIMGNDQALIDRLVAAGRETGEPLWQLPLVRDYREDLKSDVADVKNVGGSYGGTITGGLFLQEFVGEVAWAHLDIAGPAFAEKDLPCAPKGGTGFGLRTLLAFIAQEGQPGEPEPVR